MIRDVPPLLVCGFPAIGFSANAAGKNDLSKLDLSKLPPASTKIGLTYAKDIRPLLDASCFRCHGEGRQREELRLDSREAVLKGGENGKILIHGKSKESRMVIAVAQIDDETAMPPKRRPGGPAGAADPSDNEKAEALVDLAVLPLKEASVVVAASTHSRCQASKWMSPRSAENTTSSSFTRTTLRKRTRRF